MENETLKDTILQLAALSGEVSEEALRLLECSEKYLTNLLLELRNNQLIKRCDNDDMTGYRLSQSGKKYLMAQYPDRYGAYFRQGGITSKVRLDNTHRFRYLRMSEVNALIHTAGGVIYPGCKPPFQQSSQSSQPVYYTSFEFKNMGDLSVKINSSRAMGLLRNGGDSYLIYNTHRTPLKWEDMTEYRTRVLMEQCSGGKLHSIMTGADMECAYLLLSSNGGKQNQYYRISEYQPDMYYVPQNPDGIFLMKFAHLTDSAEHLKRKLLMGIDLPEEKTVYCDGFADERTPILFACDFDMVRLDRFKSYMDINHLTGLIFCFDFQLPVFKRYFGNTVTIRVLSTKATAELFGIPYGGKGG